MELPIKTIVVALLAIMVLVVLSLFITTQSTGQISRSASDRIFNTRCQEYKLAGCDWSVTYSSSFAEFLDACRSIYGDVSEAYSCLYLRCPSCAQDGINNANIEKELRCASMCQQCKGDQRIDVRSTCCQTFSSQCSDSHVDCGLTCP